MYMYQRCFSDLILWLLTLLPLHFGVWSKGLVPVPLVGRPRACQGDQTCKTKAQPEGGQVASSLPLGTHLPTPKRPSTLVTCKAGEREKVKSPSTPKGRTTKNECHYVAMELTSGLLYTVWMSHLLLNLYTRHTRNEYTMMQFSWLQQKIDHCSTAHITCMYMYM